MIKDIFKGIGIILIGMITVIIGKSCTKSNTITILYDNATCVKEIKYNTYYLIECADIKDDITIPLSVIDSLTYKRLHLKNNSLVEE